MACVRQVFLGLHHSIPLSVGRTSLWRFGTTTQPLRVLDTTNLFSTAVPPTQDKSDASAAAAAPDRGAGSAASEELANANKKLSEEVVAVKKQAEEMQDKYRRALAEMENVRQRMRRQVDEAKQFGIQGFCKDLLEVADILGQASAAGPSQLEDAGKAQSVDEALPLVRSAVEGLRMTNTQLHKVFTRHGLALIEPAKGAHFDPDVHEALFQRPPSPENQEKEGSVCEVVKVGYTLHQRTLRPAIVGVVGPSA